MLLSKQLLTARRWKNMNKFNHLALFKFVLTVPREINSI